MKAISTQDQAKRDLIEWAIIAVAIACAWATVTYTAVVSAMRLPALFTGVLLTFGYWRLMRELVGVYFGYERYIGRVRLKRLLAASAVAEVEPVIAVAEIATSISWPRLFWRWVIWIVVCIDGFNVVSGMLVGVSTADQISFLTWLPLLESVLVSGIFTITCWAFVRNKHAKVWGNTFPLISGSIIALSIGLGIGYLAR